MKLHKKLVLSGLIQTCLMLTILPAHALTEQELLKGLDNNQPHQSFQGNLSAQVYRQNADPLVTRVEIVFKNPSHYLVTYSNPVSIRGTSLFMHKGVSGAYFPDEKLFFTHFISSLPLEVFNLSFPQDFKLLLKNYKIKIHSETTIAGYITHPVDFITRHHAQYQIGDRQELIPRTPRRRFWFLESNSKSSFTVLKEARYWDHVDSKGNRRLFDKAYYEMSYLVFSPQPVSPQTDKLKPENLSPLSLSAPIQGSNLSYTSETEAEANEKIDIIQPAYLPKGFELRDIQVYRAKEGALQTLNYTDGLNRMTIMIHPNIPFFNELGEFYTDPTKGPPSSVLAMHFPYNFYHHHKTERAAFVFGDVPPLELDKVANSLNY